jgi:hypothetical protein
MDAVKSFVVVRFQFEGVHCWPGAPQDGPTPFLREMHRHMFHVTAKKAVTHDDRDIEFIHLKRLLLQACLANFCGPHTLSCETMAATLLNKFGLDSCEVSEDGENGGLVERG